MHQPYGFLNFIFGCLLSFLLKTIIEYHNLSFIKTAEYPVNIGTYFNPDFIESISTFNVVEKLS